MNRHSPVPWTRPPAAMRHRGLAFALFTTLLPSAGFCQDEPKAQPPRAPDFSSLPQDKVALLGKLPAEPGWTSVTPDGRTLQMVGRKGSRHAVFVNGVANQVYDEILPSIRINANEVPVPPYTADGSVTFFVARKGSSYYLVANGTESPAFNQILGFWIAPAGNGYALMGTREGKLVVHRDGKDLPSPPGIDTAAEAQGLIADRKFIPYVSSAAFSPDGKHFVYRAQRTGTGTPKAGLAWILDNVPLKPFPDYPPGFVINASTEWIFGPAGTYAYLEPADQGQMCVNFNGNPGPAFIGIKDLHISEDGQHLAYQAERVPTAKEIDAALPKLEGETDDTYRKRRASLEPSKGDTSGVYLSRRRLVGINSTMGRAMLDHKELPIPGDVRDILHGLLLGRQGQVAAIYRSQWENGQRRASEAWRVWVDGKTSMEYQGYLGTRLSPDGSTAISFVTQQQKVYLLKNTEELEEVYQNVDLTRFSFTPDGKAYSFPATSVDGKPVQHDSGRDAGAGEAPAGTRIQSADGKQELVIAAGERPYGSPVAFNQLIAGGKTFPIPGEVVEAQLSPDGSRIACTFKPGGKDLNPEHTRAWVDGAEIPPLDGQYSATELQFSPDGKHFSFTAKVDVKDHPDKPQGASGHMVHVRMIDGRPGPMAYLDYKVQAQDKRLGSHLKELMYPTTFGDDGSASYFARHGGSLYRITLPRDFIASMPDLAKLAGTQAAAAGDAAKQKEQTKKAASAAAPFQIPQILEWPYGEEGPALAEGNDGHIYGSAHVGRFKSGALFRCKRDGSDFKVLHEFDGGEGDGLAIRSMLKGSDGTLYMALGPSRYAANPGKAKSAIFKLAPGTEKPVPMYLAPAGMPMDAGDCDVLEYPMFSQITSNDTIYGGLAGRTLLGFSFRYSLKPQPTLEIISDNSHNAWTIEKKGTNLIAKLGLSLNENKGKTGQLPLEAGDRVYSVTGGGRGGAGMIVSTARDGSDIRTEYEFTLESPEGGNPSPLIHLGADGFIYGVTTQGGSRPDGSLNHGAVYRFEPATKKCLPIALSDHYHRIERPLMGPDGKIYVIAWNGLFRLPPDTAATGGPFTFPDPNKKPVKNPSARYAERIHTFTDIPEKKISGWAIYSLLCCTDGGFVGIGGDAGQFQPPFLFMVRPPQ